MLDEYIKNNYDEMKKILRDLCLIPAPSHHEEKRAEYCKKWLESVGCENVYIDSAQNVVFPLNCDGSDEITVFVAHTDTVFPDMEPMPYYEENGRAYSPGVGDDTASVVVLMMCAKYLVENRIKPDKGVLFVCNSCEEGLGNLKGVRQIMSDFSGRVKQFVSFDANIGHMHPDCVGSSRYEVTVKCEGGHSLYEFGKENAIHKLSEIVTEIYNIKVPDKEGKKTTYNVGIIEGGTSVNTIAQSAKMLCEYRSDDAECLEIMRDKFVKIFENAKCDEAEIEVKIIGERPCSNVDEAKQTGLVKKCENAMMRVTKETVNHQNASTDCNVPASMGIPSVCIGVFKGGGMHTREEYIELDSLKPGLEIGINTVLDLTAKD